MSGSQLLHAPLVVVITRSKFSWCINLRLCGLCLWRSKLGVDSYGRYNLLMTDVSKKKVALVTGATGVIGRAISLELAKNGHQIAVHYHENKPEEKEPSDQPG